jgi:hypothetical protein
MAITNGYATLQELKLRLDITDSGADTVLEDVVEAASRTIDGWCSRTFYAETATRYLTAEMIDALFLPSDLIAVTTLKTDEDGDRVYETTWDTSDYDLDPDGGPPYTAIYPTINGSYLFPTHRRGIQIAGSWGYAATVPEAVREACLLQAARLFKRMDAPFGIAGSSDLGQLQAISAIDPDVKQLVMPYRKFAIMGV